MKQGECGTNMRPEDMTPNDRKQIADFRALLQVEASRRAGGDPSVCNILEAAIYPEGIGRTPVDGAPES